MYRVVTTGYHKVLFSAGWGTKEAENLFLTHIWEPGCWCAGVLCHMAYEIAHFSCCRLPLPDLLPTHPSSFFGVFFLEDSFSISCLLWGDLFVFSVWVTPVFKLFFRTSLFVLLWMYSFVLHGSAWHSYQLCMRIIIIVY